jgi:hypothetical protein
MVKLNSVKAFIYLLISVTKVGTEDHMCVHVCICVPYIRMKKF